MPIRDESQNPLDILTAVASGSNGRKHPVPQNVMDVEFKVVGDLTLRQLMFLIISGGVAYLFYKSALPTFWGVTFAILSVVVGIAIAFIPYQERGLDKWLVLFLSAMRVETQMIWRKSYSHPAYFLADYAAIIKNEIITLTPTKSRNKLDQYLGLLEDEPDPMDMYKKSQMEKISVGLRASDTQSGGFTADVEPADTQLSNLYIRVIDMKTSEPAQTSVPEQPQPVETQAPIQTAPVFNSPYNIPELAKTIEQKPQVKEEPKTAQENQPQGVPLSLSQNQVKAQTQQAQPINLSLSQNNAQLVQAPVIPKIQLPAVTQPQSQPVPAVPPQPQATTSPTPQVAQPAAKAPTPEPRKDFYQEVIKPASAQHVFRNQINQSKSEQHLLESKPSKADIIKDELEMKDEFLEAYQTGKIEVLTSTQVDRPIQSWSQEFKSQLKGEIKINTGTRLPPTIVAQNIKEIKNQEQFLEKKVLELMLTAEKAKEEYESKGFKIEDNPRMEFFKTTYQELKKQSKNLSTEIDKNSSRVNMLEGQKQKEPLEKQVKELTQQNKDLEEKLTQIQSQLFELKKHPEEKAAEPQSATTDPQASQSQSNTPDDNLNMIEGTIKDKAGNLIENAVILIKDGKGNVVRALKSNKIGQFRTQTPLSNGTYDVEAIKGGEKFDIIRVEANGRQISPVYLFGKP